MPELDEILAERGARYGDFNDNAEIAQRIKDTIASGPTWDRFRAVHREGVHQIAAKLSRIACGDPEYEDNWRDIAGFATITADRCRKMENPATYAIPKTLSESVLRHGREETLDDVIYKQEPFETFQKPLGPGDTTAFGLKIPVDGK